MLQVWSRGGIMQW